MTRLIALIAAIGLLAALPATAAEGGAFILLPAQLNWQPNSNQLRSYRRMHNECH